MVLPLTLPLAAGVRAQTPAQLTIDTGKVVSPVSPMLYGLMTEGDQPLVRRRVVRAAHQQPDVSRQTGRGTESWGLIRNGNARASASLDKASGPSKALPTSLKLVVEAASAGSEAGLSNTGYWGIPARPNSVYRGSFYAKVEGTPGPLTARIVDDNTACRAGGSQRRAARGGVVESTTTR